MSTRARRWWLLAIAVGAAIAVALGWRATGSPRPSAAVGRAAEPGAARAARSPGAASPGSPAAFFVSGIVRDDQQAPVPGVEVAFLEDRGETTAITDSDGRYAVALRAGDYRAFAHGDGILAMASAEVRVFRDDAEIDLEVTAAGVLEGRLLDARGRPIAGARVRPIDDAEAVLATDNDVTATDGWFHLEARTGPTFVGVEHPDHPHVFLPDDSIDVRRGETEVVELRMPGACVVDGRVVDEHGEAIARADLVARTGPAYSDKAERVAPIEGGRFRWRIPVDEQTHFLDVAFQGLTTTHDDDAEVVDATTRAGAAPRVRCPSPRRIDVRLTVATEPLLDGVLVDDEGAAIAGAELILRSERPGSQDETQLRTGPDGRWALHARGPATVTVFALDDRGRLAIEELAAPARNVKLVARASASVTGRVAGVDAGWLTYTMSACRGVMWNATLDPRTRRAPIIDGRYRIDDLPACGVNLALVHGQQTRWEQLDLAPGQVAVVDLDGTTTLRTIPGRIRRTDDRDWTFTGRVVPAQGSGRAPQPIRIAPDGSFVANAAIGDVVIIQGAAGHLGATSKTTVELDLVDIQVELPRRRPF